MFSSIPYSGKTPQGTRDLSQLSIFSSVFEEKHVIIILSISITVLLKNYVI